MKRFYSAGGIVVNKNNGEDNILLIRTQSLKDPAIEYWGLPKGHIEKGESSKVAALREVKEETGIEVEIINKVGETNYIYFSPIEKERVFKKVIIYLMEYKGGDLKAQTSEILEVGWFTLDKALERLSFKDDKQLLQKALDK